MAKAFTIRRVPRSGCTTAVRYFGPDYLGTGTVQDLSKQGCRVTGSWTVTPGTSIILHLQLPEDLGSEWFWIDQAIVRWSEDKTFGIEFLSLDDKAKDFLAYALGDFEES